MEILIILLIIIQLTSSLIDLLMESVTLPFCRIVFDIIGNTLIFGIIADNMVMKSGLPAEIRVCFPGIYRAYSFVLINDYANRAGMPLGVIAP